MVGLGPLYRAAVGTTATRIPPKDEDGGGGGRLMPAARGKQPDGRSRRGVKLYTRSESPRVSCTGARAGGGDAPSLAVANNPKPARTRSALLDLHACKP